MFMATKSGLLGLWRIDRHIRDARGPDATFRGIVTVSTTKSTTNVLRMEEDGHITVGTNPPLPATRVYKWLFTRPDLVEVLFADDRPFHEIDLTSPRPRARHDCAPDTYLVEYAFDLPDRWSAIWTVSGPRKDYVMTSHMTRARNPSNP